MNRFVQFALIAAVGCLIASSHLVLRQGMRQMGEITLSWRYLRGAATSPFIWFSVGAGVLTFVLYAALLARTRVTMAAPTVAAVAYLVIFVVSGAWGRERISVGNIIGVALLPLAIWLLSRGSS